MAKSLEELAKHRDALLLAEVAAWLHMFGKFHEGFLKGDHELDIKIPDEVPDELLKLLKEGTWAGNIWNRLPIKELRAKGLRISDLIERHRRFKKGSEGLIQLMADAHGRGSGIEKGILDRFGSPQEVNVFLSTSLGYEGDSNINLDEIQNRRLLLYDFLYLQLKRLKNRNVKLSLDEWMTLRSELIKKLTTEFQITVAETRRPLNDVALFDQTAISVAFFKAALAQNLLLGKWIDPSQRKAEDKYHWRLLKVGLDGLTFWGNSARIGDLLARKALIADALDKVRNLLEEVFPLGLEIYRDESGSIFIVPDIDDLLMHTDNTQTLEQRIQNIASTSFSGEAQFILLPSPRTRDTLLFGELATKGLALPSPQFSWLQQQWQGKARDICSVCGLRPQGPSTKAVRRRVCDTCERRRSDRSKDWIKNPATTIWIDEVADKYGQLVLFVARFDLVNWLSGNAFNTVLSFDPRSRKLFDKNQNPPEYHFDLPTLNNNIQNGLKSGQKFEDNLLGRLVIDSKRGGLDEIKEFYGFHVTHTDIGTLSPISSPELLTLSLIRQSPSFARIRRTWETIKEFWKDVEADFKDKVEAVDTRILIRGGFIPHTNDSRVPIVSHTYEIKVRGISLSITCIKENEFLTVDNLQRVAILLGGSEEQTSNYSSSSQYVFNQIRSELENNRIISLEEPTGYGGSNTILGTLEITELFREQGTSYLPVITILTEPQTFMAFLPANSAWNIAYAIKDKYEKEMSKVRNRLSLEIGIIFSGRRTPLPAILDAGRRMLRQPTTDESWKIEKVDLSNLPVEVKLALKKEEHSFQIAIPVVMGDGKTEDAWYPYWCVEKDESGNVPSGRRRQFPGINGKEWVHVSDLHVGDIVHFTPSRFDFEFLETAAQRFEISYEADKRRGSKHPRRPYYLEELDEIDVLWKTLAGEGGLTTTQIHNLIELIEGTRLEWQGHWDQQVFEQIVCDALDEAGWKKEKHPRRDPDLFKKLHRAAVSGQLADVVELNMRILKKKPARDQEEEKK